MKVTHRRGRALARDQAYPPIGEALDAIMKGFKAFAATGVSFASRNDSLDRSV